MACCFGGGVKEPEKPERQELSGSLSTVKEESTQKEEADEKAAEDLRQAQEEAKRREEERQKADEARRLEEEKRREDTLAREMERVAEAASAQRASEARARVGAQEVVVRKELRRMPLKEQKRFCDAMHKLMENKDNTPGTSEFFRIAGYRGWPSDLCHRGEETFPGWHRGYLVELERALVEADLELGGDGDIGLPYWDWMSVEGEEVVPKCIRDSFATLPLGLVDPEQAGDLGTLGFAQLASDVELRGYLKKGRITSMVESCFTDTHHWMFASRQCRRRGFSIEAVHDQVCMGCSFPVSDTAYGAFHPLYFLLLCNLDRIYEQYLQLETPEECRHDFQLRQEALRENRGEPNRFEKALDPFKHPFKKRPLLPADTFSTTELGYAYEELPEMPAMRQPSPEDDAYRESGAGDDNAPVDCVVVDNNTCGGGSEEGEEPIYAAFRGLNHSFLGDRSHSLHVFVMHRDDAASWAPPIQPPTPSGWEAPRAAHVGWEDMSEYAGCGTALGGGSSSSSASSGSSSVVRQPFDVLVEVTQTLKNMRLSIYDAELQVLCVHQNGRVVPLEDTPLAPPALIGPIFEEPMFELCEGCRGGEVSTLQRRLGMFGYDPGPIDGHFGKQVRKAVTRFQEFVHLTSEDGSAGVLTKAKLAAQRKDLMPDLGAPTVPKRFVDGETVLYAVLTLPRHLERHKSLALEEIAHAFAQWGKATNLTFAPAEEGGPPPVLTICFEDLAELGAQHYGGLARPGGQLSASAKDGITLDASEYWLLRGHDAPSRRPKAVRLYPVLLHAIGHCLGLPHSSDRASVMWPYYDHACQEPQLAEVDVLLARSLVKNAKPCGCDFKESPQSCALQ